MRFRFKTRLPGMPQPLARRVIFGPGSAWEPAPLPQGVELVRETTPARWFEESAPRHPFNSVGQLLPDTFEAYARVFHPAYRDDAPVRWQTVASWTGKRVHPLMAFERVAAIADGPMSRPAWGYRPLTGVGPIDELVAAVRSFTHSPERCWIGLWDGFGGLEMVEELRTAPRISRPHRSYILFQGPIDAVSAFGCAGTPWQPPNLWWPDDRAWFVSTDIDLASTYVGGSRASIEAILADERLEALPSNAHDPLGVDCDTINGPVRPEST
jgi:hypothetical protein